MLSNELAIRTYKMTLEKLSGFQMHEEDSRIRRS